ncbi:MAG: hypothetical protein KA152_17075, partial [Verrucomicrobiales bacterium]|nr:hypothetical protein [Verrucomicrobiales bacterium]
LGQHYLYAGVFGILKPLLRWAGDEMAEDAARFLIVEELRKGYDAHRRAREHLAGGSRSPGTLIGVIAQVVENIESSTDWPTGAFSTDPHRCQFD